MTAHHMAYFVGQHAGQLRFGLEVFQQTLRDEHLPTGQREGIEGLVVGQQVKLEFVGRLASFGAGNDFLTYLLHGGPRLRVGADATVLRSHGRRCLQAQGYFLVSAHAHVLGFASHLVLGGVEIIAKKRDRRHDDGNDEAEIESHGKGKLIE